MYVRERDGMCEIFLQSKISGYMVYAMVQLHQYAPSQNFLIIKPPRSLAVACMVP